MKVLVTGAAGMVGRKFCVKLSEVGALGGKKVSHLIVSDVIPSPHLQNPPFEVESSVSDLSTQGVAEKLIAGRPDIIFHIAAIVSGEAEADFDKGYRINLGGTQFLFDAIRRAEYNPRLIFTSSIAIFGAPFPEV